MSPTQLTLRELRKTCDLVQVVEKWNPHARIRQDLFGFIDILALRGEETIAVQCTAWSSMSARIKKIAESETVGHVRKAGWKILVQGWKKDKKTGHYTMREIDVS